MNLLFRLSQDVDSFENIDKSRNFFKEILPQRDNNYFFHSKKIGERLKENDIIYFSYDSHIIAKAIYENVIETNTERDEKFIHGHKIKHIEIIYSDLKLNTETVTTRTIYATNEVQLDIDRVIKDNYIEIYPDEINGENFIEGAKKIVTVNAYERNHKARKECIKHYGVKCYICDFDFEGVYGEEGKGFIHVHHEKPLFTIQEEYQVDPIKDLKPVCPNCDAMLHRNRLSERSIDCIKEMIGKNAL
jgi:hypothetical protein